MSFSIPRALFLFSRTQSLDNGTKTFTATAYIKFRRAIQQIKENEIFVFVFAVVAVVSLNSMACTHYKYFFISLTTMKGPTREIQVYLTFGDFLSCSEREKKTSVVEIGTHTDRKPARRFQHTGNERLEFSRTRHNTRIAYISKY